MTNQAGDRRDLRTYLRPVLSRWWLILAVVPIVTAGAYFYYDSKPKEYASSTELFVQPSAINQILLGNNTSTEATVENLALLIQTRAVARQAERQLARQGAARCSGSIDASPLEKSNFIVVTGVSTRPRCAALLANAYASSFLRIQERQINGEVSQAITVAQKQMSELGGDPADLAKRQALEEKIQTLNLITSQVGGDTGINIVERAFPSSIPTGSDPLSNAIFALVVSLMLTIAAAFGMEYLTRKISSVEDAEEVLGLPVLTEVPKVDRPTPFLPDGAEMQKQLHEPFHRLQMNLDMLSHERQLRTILIASAAPGEGKSVVTRNLGLAYREAGRNVALLDADFRKATLGGLLEAQEGPGLTDILTGRASFGQALQEVKIPVTQNGNGGSGAYIATAAGSPAQMSHGDFALVPAGAQYGNLAATLASGGMRHTLKAATDVYDRVLIDSSPILAAADVLPLLSEVDGVLIVTRVGVSTCDSARRLLSELNRLPDVNVIGVVVNGIPPRTYRTRAYGYYYG